MTPSNGKAYSYVRFSTPEQAKGRSKARQEEECAKYCAAHNLTLATGKEYTFFDPGMSALRGDHLGEKGQLARFLGLVKDGTIARGSTLIVESLDRLDRQDVFKALPRFMDLLSSGIRIVTLKDGKEYHEGSQPQDLILSIFIFARANEESLTKGGRVADAFESKRKAAAESRKPMGKVGPKWLRLSDDKSRYEVLPEMVKTVERIFELTILGYGKNAIAKMLNAEGRPALKADQGIEYWSISSVSHIVRNRAVLGEWQAQTKRLDPKRKERTAVGPVIENYFPQIISAQTFNEAQAAIGSRRKAQATRQTANFNVWQGVAKCLHCGSAMHIVNKGRPPKGNTYLQCSLGKRGMCQSHRVIRLDQSEQVFKLMLSRLDSLALVKDSSAKLTKELAANSALLDEKRQRREELLEVLRQVPSVSVAALVPSADAEIEELYREQQRINGELAAEEAIDFETFMARLDLANRDSRARANALLKRLDVIVFVSRSGFVVTQPGYIYDDDGETLISHRVVQFGLDYCDGMARWAEPSLWKQYRPRIGEPPHEGACRALLGMQGGFHTVLPMQAGQSAFHAEDEIAMRSEAMLEGDGQPVEDGWPANSSGLDLEPEETGTTLRAE